MSEEIHSSASCYSSAHYGQIRAGLRERFGSPDLVDISPDTIVELFPEDELLKLRAARAALWLISKQVRQDEFMEGMRVFARGVGQGTDVMLALQECGYVAKVEQPDRIAIEITEKGKQYLASLEK